MATILLSYNNRSDVATLSGGSWLASLPLTNLQDRRLGKVARSSNALTTSTTFDIDLGASATYPIGVYALVAHNLSASATVRIRASGDPTFATSLYDSGTVSAWPAGLIPTSLLEWENSNFWLGTISDQARAGFRSPYVCINTARTLARYHRVSISDTTNTDGYCQLGRLFLADIWSPTYNYQSGASLGWSDPTVIDTSVGGTRYYDQRNRYRTFTFRLGWVTQTEAYTQAMEMQRLVGMSGEVLVIPDSADATNGLRRNFLGRMSSLKQLPISETGLFSFDAELEEVI